MKEPEEGQLLRIFIDESTTLHGKSLYEVIVMKAREMHLAGATVTRGIMGFGADNLLHTSKILRLSESLPIVIEIVDSEEKIALMLPFLDEVVKDGLITLEKVKVIKYNHRS
jgi:uncharacterized protein